MLYRLAEALTLAFLHILSRFSDKPFKRRREHHALRVTLNPKAGFVGMLYTFNYALRRKRTHNKVIGSGSDRLMMGTPYLVAACEKPLH